MKSVLEAEARDEGDRAAPPDGEDHDVKRAALGSDLYTRLMTAIIRSLCIDSPSNMGQGPLGVRYPESPKCS